MMSAVPQELVLGPVLFNFLSVARAVGLSAAQHALASTAAACGHQDTFPLVAATPEHYSKANLEQTVFKKLQKCSS